MKSYKIFALFMLLGMACTEHIAAGNADNVTITVKNESNAPFKATAVWKDVNVHSHKSNTQCTVIPGETKQLSKKSMEFINLYLRNQDNVLLYDSSDKDGNQNTYFVIEEYSKGKKPYELKVTSYKNKAYYKQAASYKTAIEQKKQK